MIMKQVFYIVLYGKQVFKKLEFILVNLVNFVQTLKRYITKNYKLATLQVLEIENT